MFDELLQRYAERTKEIMNCRELKSIVWEATRNCNLACKHCYAPREEAVHGKELTREEVKSMFYEISQDFDASALSILITGGEPTLRSDLIEITSFLSSLKFNVSVTTNGVLLGEHPSMIDKLVQSGVKKVSVSIDGLKVSYRRQRGVDCFEKAIAAVTYITQRHPQIQCAVNTTVTQFNFDDILSLSRLLRKLGVRIWKINVARPLGRAPVSSKCFISSLRFRELLDWIKKQNLQCKDRYSGPRIEVLDIGWLGKEFEGIVRSSLFFCYAGLTCGCILYDGKVGACPEVPRQINVQGDIRKERFRDIWRERYEKFRTRSWMRLPVCSSCSELKYCWGGPICLRTAGGEMLDCTYLKLSGVLQFGY